MTVRCLYVPLSLPLRFTRPMIARELRYREVLSFKVETNLLVIEHDELSHESKAELLSCIEGPIVVRR